MTLFEKDKKKSEKLDRTEHYFLKKNSSAMVHSLRSLSLVLLCLFLLLATCDALSSKVGQRSPKLSSRKSPHAAQLRDEIDVADADTDTAADADDKPTSKTFSASSSSSSSTRFWPLSPRPVQVTLYGESRCPFCADWVVKNSRRLVDQIGDIIDFRLVEWGNAKRKNGTTGEIACQHGPSECLANALFACTREAFSSGKKGKGGEDENPYRWLNVVACSEKDVYEHAADPGDSFDDCVIEEVKRAGSPFDFDGALGSDPSGDGEDDGDKVGRAVAARLRACASGPEGAALIAENEKETDALVPKHTFVPWIVVDGLPLGGASLETTRSVACAAWRGHRGERPEACVAAPGLQQQQQGQSRSIF